MRRRPSCSSPRACCSTPPCGRRAPISSGSSGFGGDRDNDYSTEFEGSAAFLLTRKVAVGVEYRGQPNNLSFAEQNRWIDAFVAFFPTRNVSLTAAAVDLGSIAGQPRTTRRLRVRAGRILRCAMMPLSRASLRRSTRRARGVVAASGRAADTLYDDLGGDARVTNLSARRWRSRSRTRASPRISTTSTSIGCTSASCCRSARLPAVPANIPAAICTRPTRGCTSRPSTSTLWSRICRSRWTVPDVPYLDAELAVGDPRADVSRHRHPIAGRCKPRPTSLLDVNDQLHLRMDVAMHRKGAANGRNVL